MGREAEFCAVGGNFGEVGWISLGNWVTGAIGGIVKGVDDGVTVFALPTCPMMLEPW